MVHLFTVTSEGLTMSKIDLDIIWDALHEYREEMSDQGATHFEDKWDDICYQMALIEEALQEGGIL